KWAARGTARQGGVTNHMAFAISHLTGIRRQWRIAALLLGAAIFTSSASSQQPAAKKAPGAAPTGASPLATGERAAGGKVCEKVTATATTDGKSETKDHNICLTQNERLDPNSGLLRFSAAVRQVDDSDKQHLMVTVPLGLMLPPGLRTIVYPK